MLLLFSLTLFLSAALLFMVQPMIAKMILPLLGGSSSVWTTCMLFFQTLLLAGYAYAHAAPRWLGTRRHAIVHAILLLLPLLVIPIRVSGWTPPATANPLAWLLGLLFVTVGLPFFMLSTLAPLLQRWFAETTHEAGHDPYFLYAASNTGSLLALLAYPFVVEPNLKLGTQTWVWTGGYLVLVLLVAACAFVLWRRHRVGARGSAAAEAPPSTPSPGDRSAAGAAPTVGRRLRWIAWSFVPSCLMLGLTTYITTDIAPFPLLWVVPLALYLLSFIIVFARPPAWTHRVLIGVLALAVIRLAMLRLSHTPVSVAELLIVHFVTFFVAALVCHGELARTRPEAGYLTEFYLWMAFGGMLGGVFNALIAPRIFDRVIEYPLAYALVCLLRPRFGAAAPEPRRAATPAPSRAARRAGGKPPPGSAPAMPRGGVVHALVTVGWVVMGLGVAAVFLAQSIGGDPRLVLHSDRSFFGVNRVKLGPLPTMVSLFHGTTTHGIQSRVPADRGIPMGYYHRTGPIGQLMTALDSASAAPRRVGLVGLGIGTLAAYGRAGDRYTFFEIDPAVEKLATNTAYFTYVSDARARGVDLTVVLGDGRIQLARSTDRFGVIVLDAFSSDAIPLHILTREAFRLYLSRLEPGGVIAAHISSKFFDLAPVLGDLAADAGLVCLYQKDASTTPEERRQGKLSSQWVVMARNAADLDALARDSRWTRLPARPGVRVWTDDYSNALSVILWGG